MAEKRQSGEHGARAELCMKAFEGSQDTVWAGSGMGKRWGEEGGKACRLSESQRKKQRCAVATVLHEVPQTASWLQGLPRHRGIPGLRSLFSWAACWAGGDIKASLFRPHVGILTGCTPWRLMNEKNLLPEQQKLDIKITGFCVFSRSFWLSLHGGRGAPKGPKRMWELLNSD